MEFVKYISCVMQTCAKTATRTYLCYVSKLMDSAFEYFPRWSHYVFRSKRSFPAPAIHLFWAFVLSTRSMVSSGRTLQITKEILTKKGLELPHHVAFQADNTCREMRNSWTFLWSSWLISHGVMRTVDEFYYKVGHTQNECDQRFWVLSSTLSRETTLQSPED